MVLYNVAQNALTTDLFVDKFSNIVLFGGVPPTLEELQAFLDPSTLSIDSAAIFNANVPLIFWQSYTTTIDLDRSVVKPNKMVLHIEDYGKSDPVFVADGIATWFMLGFRANTWLQTTSTYPCYDLLFGSVGDLNSSADLKMVSQQISAATSITFSKMNFDFDPFQRMLE